MNEVERLWASLLSRDGNQVRTTWDTLDAEEQQAIHTHLMRMVTEGGWAEPQRISAQAALNVLRDRITPDHSDATPNDT